MQVGTGLVHFHDACGLDDGRALLALGEAGGTLAVDIDAGELFPVLIVNGDLPVAVFAAPVVVKTGGFSRPLLEHDGHLSKIGLSQSSEGQRKYIVKSKRSYNSSALKMNPLGG